MRGYSAGRIVRSPSRSASSSARTWLAMKSGPRCVLVTSAYVRFEAPIEPRLIEELTLAHADGTYTRLLGRLAKVDALVLDDWGIAPLRDQERRDMLEIVEDRHGARATIITSQLPVENRARLRRRSDNRRRAPRSRCAHRTPNQIEGTNAQEAVGLTPDQNVASESHWRRRSS
jgi:hypothetical protein